MPYGTARSPVLTQHMRAGGAGGGGRERVERGEGDAERGATEGDEREGGRGEGGRWVDEKSWGGGRERERRGESGKRVEVTPPPLFRLSVARYAFAMRCPVLT
eukprot:1363694-Rhodomonas_salina.3